MFKFFKSKPKKMYCEYIFNNRLWVITGDVGIANCNKIIQQRGHAPKEINMRLK